MLLFEGLLKQSHSLLDALWMFLTYGKTFKTPEQKAALQKQYTIWSQSIQSGDVKRNYLYAFKDLFYKNIVGKKAVERSVSSFKKANLNFLFIHEYLLLAILINHPNLLDETSDDMASLDFKEAHLCDVKEALLRFYAERTSNEMDLKEYLLREGFESEMTAILSPQILIHGAFAKPSASLEEAREGWKEIFNRLQVFLGKNDLKEAQEHLAKEMSESAWQRLKMLRKSTLV